MDLIERSLSVFHSLGTRRRVAHWTVILGMYKADVDIEQAKNLTLTGLRLCRREDLEGDDLPGCQFHNVDCRTGLSLGQVTRIGLDLRKCIPMQRAGRR